MQHTFWSSSSFKPKIFQNMSKSIKVMERTRMRLWPSASGEITAYQRKWELPLLHVTGLLVLFSSLPNIIKLSQTVWELWPAQEFGFRGDNITKEVRVGFWEGLRFVIVALPGLFSYFFLSCLHRTCWLVLLFICTKYYQNMSKGVKVMELTRTCLQISASG